MAQEVLSFKVPKNKYDEVTGGEAPVTFQIVYYDDEPAGYEITATGPGGTTVVCPRPCPNVVLPT